MADKVRENVADILIELYEENSNRPENENSDSSLLEDIDIAAEILEFSQPEESATSDGWLTQLAGKETDESTN